MRYCKKCILPETHETVEFDADGKIGVVSMLYSEEIRGKSVSLRMAELSDCVQYYLDWLNDEETNRYLETRWGGDSLLRKLRISSIL